MFNFEPWQLGLLEEYGYGTTKTALINRVVRRLKERGCKHLEFDEFVDACYECEISPTEFTQADIRQISDKIQM